MKHNNDNTIDKLSKKLKFYKIGAMVLIPIFIIVVFLLLRHLFLFGTHLEINKYPLIDPAREFIPQKNFVINIQPLREYLSKIGEEYPNNISIYYEQLNSGANIAVNKDLKLYVASLIKLPIALVALKQIEKGNWKWDTVFPIKGSDVDQDSGNLYKNTMNFDPKNDLLTVEKIINALLIDSDNTAQNILVSNLPQSEFDEFELEVGLEDVFDDAGHASAKEYSRILRTLYTSSFLKRINSQKILELLGQATYKNLLSQGIPSNVVFSHKYGENAKEFIFADSGIVYVPGKPYMLTVILKGQDASDSTIEWAQNLMKEIGEHVYEASK